MKTYYIYHIPGKKIGCSTQPAKRVQKQGYTEFEILEQHTDIHTADQREKELQVEYGYKVDRNSYKVAVANRPKLTNDIRSLGGTKTYELHGGFTSEECALGGKVTGRKNVESGRVAELGRISGSKIRNCPYCDRELKGGGAFNSHTKKCKQKVG